VFYDSDSPLGKDGVFATFEDGLKIMGSSDATKLGGDIRPFDFCDIDNDGNTSEFLPFDAEGVAYESTGPYHAGSYQLLGSPRTIKAQLDAAGNVIISFTRNKSGGRTPAAQYIYNYGGCYQTLEYSYNLQDWFLVDLSGMQLQQTPISGKAFEFCENIAFSKSTSSTSKTFYRIKYSNTAPTIAF
jgi:hypothetical protein